MAFRLWILFMKWEWEHVYVWFASYMHDSPCTYTYMKQRASPNIYDYRQWKIRNPSRYFLEVNAFLFSHCMTLDSVINPFSIPYGLIIDYLYESRALTIPSSKFTAPTVTKVPRPYSQTWKAVFILTENGSPTQPVIHNVVISRWKDSCEPKPVRVFLEQLSNCIKLAIHTSPFKSKKDSNCNLSAEGKVYAHI